MRCAIMRILAVSVVSLAALSGCGGAGDDPELSPVEESQDELQTAAKLVGDYTEGRGRYASLSLLQVSERGRKVNKFEAEQIVQCVRAPCPTMKLAGKWFARGSDLTLYPEGRDRMTFRVKLDEGKLTLKDARGVDVAELTKAVPAPSGVEEILSRHRVPNMKVQIDQAEVDAQQRASGVMVKFKDALDKAVELFLTDEQGLKGNIQGMEDDVREQCSGQRDLVRCIANDPQTSVSLLKRSDESAPQGETAADGWVIVFFTSSFTDHGYYAVISKSQAGEASIYNFN
jgi:hypothetical protein